MVHSDQYGELLGFIKFKAEQKRSFKVELREVLKKRFPDVWERCMSRANRTDGKAGAPTIDFGKLYETIGAQSSSPCLHCGSPTSLHPDFLVPREFCSCKCAASHSSPFVGDAKFTFDPSKHGVLKEYVQKHYAKEKPVSREWLSAKIQSSFPDLWLYVQKTSGRRRGKGTVDWEKFLSSIDLPTSGDCLWCGDTTTIEPRSMKPRDFCSCSCNSSFQANSRDAVENWHRRHMARKTFVSKAGDLYQCQGYEPLVLEFIDGNSEVSAYRTRGFPSVKYKLDPTKKNRSYHPDILVSLNSGKNLLVEVKCKHTLLDDLETNIAKFKAANKYCERWSEFTESDCEFWLAVTEGKGHPIRWFKSPSEKLIRRICE